MNQVERHFTQAREAIAAAGAAPLSRRKAMLAALLVDQAAEAMFRASGEDDLLAFRARTGARSEALALVFGLCALDPAGPRLVTEAVEVPIAAYPSLAVEDFMVSLYNGRTVMRVLIADGAARHDVHEVLAQALTDLSAGFQ